MKSEQFVALWLVFESFSVESEAAVSDLRIAALLSRRGLGPMPPTSRTLKRMSILDRRNALFFLRGDISIALMRMQEREITTE